MKENWQRKGHWRGKALIEEGALAGEGVQQEKEPLRSGHQATRKRDGGCGPSYVIGLIEV